MTAEFANAFNIRNMTNAADARATWLEMQQPKKPVAIVTEMQDAMLAAQRTRERLGGIPCDAV